MSRPRRRRGAQESLLQIVLVLEALLMFFVTLVSFGLKVLEPAFPAWVALPAGGVFILVLAAASGFVRHRAGVVAGWALQAAILATGFLLPVMFAVGAGFAAMWVYCAVRGAQLDRQAAAAAAAEGSSAS